MTLMMNKKSGFGLAFVGLFVVFAGLLVSRHSATLAQDTTPMTQNEAFQSLRVPSQSQLPLFRRPTTSPLFPPPTSLQPQHSDQKKYAIGGATDVKMLMRATYLLPVESADVLIQLFGHESTSLIECQKRKPADGSRLVRLVITTEPDTHEAISKFISKVFPSDNLTSFDSVPQTPFSSNDADSPSTVLPAAKKTVFVKLPGMTCQACVKTVENYLKNERTVIKVKVLLKEQQIVLTCASNTDVENLLKKAAATSRVFENYSTESPFTFY